MMRPQNQRSTRTPNRGAKDDLRPTPVAHNGTKAAANQYFLKAVPRSPYRYRIPDPHLAEVVKCDPFADQLGLEPATEAESELRRHVSAQMAIPRQREQKCFYAAIQIAGADMQDAHQITST
jgi:hypothetical protein